MQCQGGLMLSLLACEPFVEVLITNYSHLVWRERERERDDEDGERNLGREKKRLSCMGILAC
jgi:hypothetical protein